MEDEPARVAGEAGSDVQESVAQALGLAAGELGSNEEQPLRPDEQVLTDQYELEPGRVGLEGAEGEVAKTALLAAADPVPRRRRGRGGAARGGRSEAPAGL